MESPNNGVCGHSSDKYWQPAVVFSIDYEDIKKQRGNFTLTLESKGIWYKELMGAYMGDVEHSYIVLADDFFDERFPMSYLDKQHCVLHLSEPEHKYNGRPTATLLANELLYGITEEITLGKFTHVTEREALDNGDYTYDPEHGNYFICEHDDV